LLSRKFSGQIYKVVSILIGILSFLIIISEISLSFRANISPLGLFFASLKTPFSIAFLATLLLAYVYFCTFFGLFNLRLASFYHMHPNGHTESASLLLNAAYTLRLSFPVALNFMDSIRVHVRFVKTGKALIFVGHCLCSCDQSRCSHSTVWFSILNILSHCCHLFRRGHILSCVWQMSTDLEIDSS